MAPDITLPPEDPELFGRQDELAAVETAVSKGCTAFGIEGPSGIGKSAVAAEVARSLQRAESAGVVKLDAAQRTSEDLAIAAIYVQLKQLVRDPSDLARRLSERLRTDASGVMRKLGAAILADIVHHVAEHAEATIDAAQEILGGETGEPSLESQLDQLDRESRRYFLTRFLGAIAETGNRVAIVIDNLDGADASLVSLVRFLITRSLQSVAFVIVYNTEVGSNQNWDNVLADLRATRGSVMQLLPLGREAIAKWFKHEFGRAPLHEELEELLEATQGRPVRLVLAMEEIRRGEKPSASDYAGYCERARRRLKEDARAVAELLSLAKRDALVPMDWLECAAARLGINNVGPALDQLRDERLVMARDGRVGFMNSTAHQSWLGTIGPLRRDALASAWLAAFEDFGVAQLAETKASVLLPPIEPLLLNTRTGAEMVDLTNRLVTAGQVDAGLRLVNRALQADCGEAMGEHKMLEYALIAARTYLELGRYAQVDEPLARAEMVAERNADAKAEVLLLRMKLALRRNSYAALAPLETRLLAESEDRGVHAQAALILNAAYRDLMDLPHLQGSVDRLLAARDSSPADQMNRIDRALARSLAKLGKLEAALAHANAAVEGSATLPSVRAVGNAKLALGEVHRYRAEYASAVSAYHSGAEIARATGNRDSLLWCLLGEAAAHVEANEPERARSPLSEVQALLAQPGYEHPLESAHATLLHALAGLADVSSDEIVGRYQRFALRWPAEYLVEFQKAGRIERTIPL